VSASAGEDCFVPFVPFTAYRVSDTPLQLPYQEWDSPQTLFNAIIQPIWELALNALSFLHENRQPRDPRRSLLVVESCATVAALSPPVFPLAPPRLDRHAPMLEILKY